MKEKNCVRIRRLLTRTSRNNIVDDVRKAGDKIGKKTTAEDVAGIFLEGVSCRSCTGTAVRKVSTPVLSLKKQMGEVEKDRA